MGKKTFIAWFCLSLAMVATSCLFIFEEKLRHNLGRIAQTQEALYLIHDLRANLYDAETVARGYIVTGEDENFEIYQIAVREAGRIFDRLKEATAKESEQQYLLGTLKILITRRHALLDNAIDLRRQNVLEGSEYALAIRWEETEIQNGLREIFGQLEGSKRMLISPEWVEEERKRRIWLWGLGFGTLLSLSLSLFTMYFLNRESNERKRMEEKLANHQEGLRSCVFELSLAEERERRRIAVHLHDQVGQTLALVNIKLGELQKSQVNVPTAQELSEISKLIEQAIHDAHTLTARISPPILYELGLEAALEWLTEQLAKQHGISTSFESDNQPKPVDDDLRVLLFQAAGELLMNVVKHAQAHKLTVSLWRDVNHLRLRVDDDGVGCDISQISSPWREHCGFGLFSIRERLNPFGGLMEVKSEPGAGTEVTLSVPLKDAVLEVSGGGAP